MRVRTQAQVAVVEMAAEAVIRMRPFFWTLLVSSLFLIVSCDAAIEPTPVPPKEKKAFEKNAIDAAGVAEGDEQVSPFGKPAH